MLRKMPLTELNGVYKGNISAALKKEADDRVTPLMTPLSRRSVRIKSTAPRSLVKPSSSVAKILSQAEQTPKSTSSSAAMDVEPTPVVDMSKINFFAPSAISTFMSQPTLTDVDKLAMIESLKKQIALVEKSIPSARPQ